MLIFMGPLKPPYLKQCEPIKFNYLREKENTGAQLQELSHSSFIGHLDFNDI